MRRRVQDVARRVGSIRTPELSPVAWTVLVFMGTILGDGVRARATRSPLSASEADLVAIGVIAAFVALVVLVATVVTALRERG